MAIQIWFSMKATIRKMTNTNPLVTTKINWQIRLLLIFILIIIQISFLRLVISITTPTC